MFCTNCGNQLTEDGRFCTFCGAERSGYAVQAAYDNKNFAVVDKSILKRLSGRVAFNAVIWILIAGDQVVTGINGIFGDDGTGIKSYLCLILFGIANFCSGISDFANRNDIQENPVGIVKRYRISKDSWKLYLWNGVIAGLCMISGDYFFMMLALLAILTDLFLVKRYVSRHKEEFLWMEQQQLLLEEQKGDTE